MRRREFMAVLGGAAATTWLFAANAQQPAIPVVGFLSARSPAEAASALAAFRHGLGQTGFFEGKNVSIEYRWAEGHYDRLPAMATEFVTQQVAVIAAVGGEPSGLAAKAATNTIPIVFPQRLLLRALLNGLGDAVSRSDGAAADRYQRRISLIAPHFETNPSVSDALERLLWASSEWLATDVAEQQVLELIERTTGLLLSYWIAFDRASGPVGLPI
jgi:putative ABC transport system substrate-binding protein